MAEQAVRLAELGEQAVRSIERQDWLDRVGGALDGVITGTFERAGEVGRRVKNFLHGTWLGHPLHPVLTDVPIGAWTAALVMDAIDRPITWNGRGRHSAGADAAIAVGVAGAAAAATAGLVDWHHTDDGARRVGLVHGLLNTAVLLLYGTSLALRRSGHRPAGRALGYAGFATMCASAYLGGTLVYRQRVGVDQSQRQRSDRFVPVLADRELLEGTMRRVDVGALRVLLVRRNGRIHALGEACTHMGGPLAEGRLEGDGVVCPWHGSRFALEDGRVIDGPATAPEPCFETRVRSGMIEVRSAAAD